MSQQQQRVVSLLQQACSLLADANNTTATASNSSSSNSSNTASTCARPTVRQLFAPYRTNGPARRRMQHPSPSVEFTTWTHRFFCLSRIDQDGTPSREEKRVLQEAGLGEIKITIPKTNSFIDLRQKLSEFFPKLNDAGGFQLLRSAVGSRNLLEVIRMPPEGYTTQYLADRCGLGQAMIYVRPLQTCLSVSPVKSQSGTEVFHEKCLKCGNDVPLMDMQKHLEVCGNSDSDMDMQTDLPPVLRRPRRDSTRPICDFACVKENRPGDEAKKDVCSCPVCGMSVPAVDIELHADQCCENDQLEGLEKGPVKHKSLEEMVTEIRGKLKNKNWTLSIRRTKIIETTMEMMADADEQDLASELMVKFIGEEGVDAGGLRRELFSLVFEKTPLLDRNTFSNEACSLQHGEYIILGKLVSLAFIYGHPGLKTLHQTIINYILNEKTPTTEIPSADVQNATVLRAIDTIQKASSKEEYMEAAIETSDLLERSGFNKPLTQDSSQSAVYTVKEYHIFYRCFGHIRQFMDGLKLHGVLDIMRLHQLEATQFLGEATALTAEVVNNFYSFSFSDKGDPNRETEEAIEYNFRRFICQVEKGRISSTVINISTETAEEDSIQVTLGLVLQAFVGCPGLPRDISSGLIEFNHNSSALSHVNTCAPSITFQNTSKLLKFEDFERTMLDIIFGCEGFGQE